MADFIDLLVSRYTFLSAFEKCLIKDTAGDQRTLEGLSISDISVITGRKHLIRNWTPGKALKEAEKAAAALAGDRIKCLCFTDAGYPAQLAEIYDPPYLLYYRGGLPDWYKPLAAVVGTRLPSGLGLDSAFELGFDFGSNRIALVSGLALGIDSAAHEGNIAGGGKSVAVLGCGLDIIYPAANRERAVRMLEGGGALFSEYPPSLEPQKFHFPERNRIISGLSRAVIVVEAPGKSGALITADFALEQGRDLYIHSAALRSRGNRNRIKRLLFDVAPVVNSAQRILDEWMPRGFGIETGLPDGEVQLSSTEAGKILAERMDNELKGYYIKFNGKNFRRACYESSYSVNS